MFNYTKFSQRIICFSFFMNRTHSFEHNLSCPKKRHCLKSFSGDSSAVIDNDLRLDEPGNNENIGQPTLSITVRSNAKKILTATEERQQPERRKPRGER